MRTCRTIPTACANRKSAWAIHGTRYRGTRRSRRSGHAPAPFSPRDPAGTATYIGNPNAAQLWQRAQRASPHQGARHQEPVFRQHRGPDAASGRELVAVRPRRARSRFPISTARRPSSSSAAIRWPRTASVWTVPDFRARVRELKAPRRAAGRIDPRRTETAKIADRHLFIQPTSDAFFLIALLKAVLALRPLHPLRTISPGWTRWPLCSPASTTPLAAPPPASAPRRGVVGRPAHQRPRRARRPARHRHPAARHAQRLADRADQYRRGPSRPRGAAPLSDPRARHAGDAAARIARQAHLAGLGPQVGAGEFPAAALAEEIETEGRGQIKALFVVAGNPVLSTPTAPGSTRRWKA